MVEGAVQWCRVLFEPHLSSPHLTSPHRIFIPSRLGDFVAILLPTDQTCALMSSKSSWPATSNK